MIKRYSRPVRSFGVTRKYWGRPGRDEAITICWKMARSLIGSIPFEKQINNNIKKRFRNEERAGMTKEGHEVE